jgi:hypothetical protein
MTMTDKPKSTRGKPPSAPREGGRYVREFRETAVTDSVTSYLVGVKLDDLGKARASIALALAKAIDEARFSTLGNVKAAVPAMSRELRETLKELAEGVDIEDPFLQDLLSDD